MSMTFAQVADLLGFASTFDQRKADLTGNTAVAWHRVLGHLDYADCENAIVAHQTGPKANEYLTVKHIVDAVAEANRSTPKLIAIDVRAARARALIGGDWPESRPLPREVADKLAAARARDRHSLERQELGAAVPSEVGDLGVELKSVQLA